ncbi:MAG: NUDIX hydrolase [Candidatus Xenobia bacterium]
MTTLRVSVLGLLRREDGWVLLIHKMTGPEPGRWDLPGGGVEAGEQMAEALRREVAEETGVTDVTLGRLRTVVERIFPRRRGGSYHSISVVYEGSASGDPAPGDTEEVGPRGVQWIDPSTLHADDCSERCWAALTGH